MAGCAYSSLQLHSDVDKKSTIDLFEQPDPRAGKTGGDDKGDIKLSLRAHFTSRPVDVDTDVDEGAEALSSSSSLSSLLSPTILGSLVTELVLYTEGAFIDRSGLRLKLRASRQGAYVERCVWQLKVKAKVSTAAGERKGRDKDKDKDKNKNEDEDITSSRLEPFSSIVEAGQNLFSSLVVRAKSQFESDSRSNKIESAMSSIDIPARGTTTASPDNAFDLSGFTVQSRRVYRIVPQLRLGDLLYTDRAHLIWFYLPAILRYAPGHDDAQQTTLHYTTLHYTTLHYTTLHYTTLRYSTCSRVHHTYSSLSTPA